jgi:hypothetical protein
VTLPPHVTGHAIRRITADLSESRSYLVGVECLCGVGMPGNRTSDYTGVLDVAIQAFFTHLAANALPNLE